MAINKVVYGNTTLIDITNTTATAADVASGKVFYGANGAQIIGTLEVPTPVYQAKTVTPTEQQQVVTADNNYDALSGVTVNAISSTYVGSDVTRRSTSDITMTDDEVDIPAGYYANAVSYFVPSAETGSASLYYHAGHGTLRADFNVISAGYISGSQSVDIDSFTGDMNVVHSDVHITPTTSQQVAADYGTFTMEGQIIVDAMPTGSVTAPSSISGTTATVTTGTNTLTLTKTVSVTPSVTTTGYVSSGTAGNSSVSLTANVTTKAAATITPTTSNQTIAAGTYLTGTQTIVGDANLVGSNILSGTSIFGVAGTVTFQTIYSGSSAPSSATGVNGDIYIQT